MSQDEVTITNEVYPQGWPIVVHVEPTGFNTIADECGDVNMIEIGLTIAVCMTMGKIADAEGRSAIVWGVITLLVCLASAVVPLPLIRILLAGVVAFVLLMVVKAWTDR